MHRLGNFLKSYDFNTGNPTEDREVHALVTQLLDDKLLCQPTFDEALLFKDHDKASLMPLMKCVARCTHIHGMCTRCTPFATHTHTPQDTCTHN